MFCTAGPLVLASFLSMNKNVVLGTIALSVARMTADLGIADLNPNLGA